MAPVLEKPLQLIILLLVSASVVVAGMNKQPGAGIAAALLLIGAVLLFGHKGLASLGLSWPGQWGKTVAVAFLLGLGISLLSTLFIDPLAVRITGNNHDLSVFGHMRGNWKLLLLWVAAAWLGAALLEEVVFRGYLLSEFARLLGRGFAGTLTALLLSTAVFSLAHWYQGPSGVISTGFVSIILSVIFILNGYNLWLPILAHGFIDTVGLLLIYLNWDLRLPRLLMR